MEDKIVIPTNEYQTPITESLLAPLPDEVREQFLDFVNNVPYIKALISPNRPRAKDLPKDDEGKIIIDLTNPHILEDMDYFRQSALHFKKYGCYTNLRPNPNPNSEYYKFVQEEVRRCREGYIRESDGEWVSGDNYFFLNYAPMLLTQRDPKTKKSFRIVDMPSFWEGHYYKAHYLNMARANGKHAAELASRSKGKSFWGAAMLAKRFVLGESSEVNKKVTCYITATDKAKLLGGDQTLDKFQYDIDHCAQYTQFPSKRLINNLQSMEWRMGYEDLDTGVKMGTLNSVVGKSSNVDASKLRGSRGVLYIFEECGTFPNLLEVYNNLRYSVEEGNNVFGLLYLYGTTGDSDSDFSSAQELMYNPFGYNIQEILNVYDKEGQGRKYFSFFFPGYLNRAGCYDENGNSDVVKAIIEILLDRYNVKYNSTNINAITKRIAEYPITPQEAVLKSRGNLFPITQLNERLNQLDNNPSEFDDVYVGDLITDSNGKISFVPSSNLPIRDFPLKDNKNEGALEIFKMPEKNKEEQVFNGRYIGGIDPVDSDEADTMSLYSIFILDLWTDQIVAEYTGRLKFADDLYELTRKLLLFYNARGLYENNLKGLYSYFARCNCTYLLADTPEYLKDKDIIKSIGYGNKSKGVHATAGINNYANDRIKEWLLKPINTLAIIDGVEQEVTIPNLFKIRNRALLKELVLYNPDINVDRIRALGMLMLYREEKMILYQGNLNRENVQTVGSDLSNDPFFTNNYDNKFF